LDWIFVHVRYLSPALKRMQELWIKGNNMNWFFGPIRLTLPLKNNMGNPRKENHIGIEVPGY